MPRISLWNPKKTNDFNFADRVIGENFTAGGCAILTHMYTGPTTDAAGGTETDITTIQDLLFLSNNSRKYDPNVFELRGHYTPVDTQYDLSSFGIFLASDTLRVTFHYQTMIDTLGRKLIAGDVLEFPSMRDIPIGDTSKGINKYYVIQDAMWFAAGYGSKWMPHIWLIKAKQMTDSPEYTDIIESAATGETAGGVGSGIGVMSPGWASSVDASGNAASKHYTDTKNSLSMLCKYLNITDAVVKEAESNVFFDPVFFQTAHLYIEVNSDGYPELLSFMSGSSIPPNGGALVGIGSAFPETILDGEYYLRTDYYPERLFQKQGSCFKYIAENLMKTWTSTNKILDGFISNNNTTVMPDGQVFAEKQAISKVIPQRVDLYAEAKKQSAATNTAHKKIADKSAITPPGPVAPTPPSCN